MPTASGALIQHNTTRRPLLKPCKRPYEFAGVQLGCGASLRALRRSDEEPSISATSSSFKTMMECSLVMSRWMTAHATRRWCSNSSVCVCVCVCVCVYVRACVRASERTKVLVCFLYVCVRVTARHIRAHTHTFSLDVIGHVIEEIIDEFGLQVLVLAALLTPLRKDHQTR